MSATSIENDDLHVDGPLLDFSKCHHEFVSQVHGALYLSDLVASAARARSIASDLGAMFRGGLVAHHVDEERELFPAVQHAANEGEERIRVDAMVDQLVREHRAVEKLWKLIEPVIDSIAAGGTPEVPGTVLEELVQHFFAHVHFEEHEFLPLAQQILSRKSREMAALGMALHIRHVQAGLGNARNA
ncbi:MAG: hemerythrin domain-containing protein [Burkholderiales bacterium]|nr:hemerythrin domain-containing protein [Burkholderiales bacterium]